MNLSKLRSIEYYFNIKLHDYGNNGDAILICSGFGLALALADNIKRIRILIDIDNYRNHIVDWECLGVCLASCDLKLAIFAGWFTIDNPVNFQKIIAGYYDNKIIYTGGQDNLNEFIAQARIL
jgi:hypothetical protein